MRIRLHGRGSQAFPPASAPHHTQPLAGDDLEGAGSNSAMLEQATACSRSDADLPPPNHVLPRIAPGSDADPPIVEFPPQVAQLNTEVAAETGSLGTVAAFSPRNRHPADSIPRACGAGSGPVPDRPPVRAAFGRGHDLGAGQMGQRAGSEVAIGHLRIRAVSLDLGGKGGRQTAGNRVVAKDTGVDMKNVHGNTFVFTLR